MLSVDIRLDGTSSMQNKLNVNAPVFMVNREPNTAGASLQANPHFLQHSKSSGNIQQKLQMDRNKFFGLSEQSSSPCMYYCMYYYYIPCTTILNFC